ncbi:MAG: flagellar export chaperone FliS, partial [Planctomycetota bacterium]
MNQNQLANSYLRTKVLTAGPEQLRMMLYEGAIKFARQALHSLNNKDFEAFYNGVSQTQKIINELDSSLNHDVAPDLCEKMASLYNYMYMRLVDANMQRDPEPITE